MCSAYIVYTTQWRARARGCVYQMSVYTIYGSERMHMHSCSLLFFCLFCLSVELLQSYQIQPPGKPFWPRFYKPAPAFPALLSIFIPLHTVFAFARKAELSQTFVFTFGCAGLQLVSPKLAFVHGVGRSVGLCSCACVYEHPWSWLSALQHSLCCLPAMLQQSPRYVCRASCALHLSEMLL